MRKLILSFVLATAGAVGLTAAEPASAHGDGRIFVSIGDVAFSYGNPYHRHSRAPLYVVHESWGPRYYYYAQPTRYYAPPRYYAPRYSQPRVYWGGYHRDRYDRHDYYDRHDRGHDRRHDRRHDRHDRRWRHHD